MQAQRRQPQARLKPCSGLIFCVGVWWHHNSMAVPHSHRRYVARALMDRRLGGRLLLSLLLRSKRGG